MFEENLGSYNGNIVTNGMLLTKNVLSELHRFGIIECQVTLDGTNQIHNVRRPSKIKTESSFNIIMQNLEEIAGKIFINLRINVDKTNMENVYALLSIFKEKGWLNSEKQFRPYIAPVFAYTDKCNNAIADTCLSSSTYFDFAIDFFKKIEKDFNIKKNPFYLYPASKKFNCGAVAFNSFVVDSAGFLYKCGLSVGDFQKSVGSVFEVDKILYNPQFNTWLDFDPFADKDCVACNLFPICLRGCPNSIISNNYVHFKENCDFLRKNFEKSLVYHVTN